MEGSISSLTFKGSISEAIVEAKKQKKLFVVYISGEDGDSVLSEQSTWMDLNVAEMISKYCIFLHILQGSIDASNFSAIYPQNSVPCITAIGYDGVQLWQHEGYVNTENLVSGIEKAWLSLHIQEATTTVLIAALASEKSKLPTSIASNVTSFEQGNSSGNDVLSSSTDNPLQDEEPKPLSNTDLIKENAGCEPRVETNNEPSEEASSESTRVNELGSGKDQQSASSTETGKTLLSPATEDLESSEVESRSFNVGDGCTTAEVSMKLNVHGSEVNCSSQITGSEAKNSEQDKKADALDNCKDVSNSNDVHLNVRLPDGASLQRKFSVTNTLRLVKDYVDENLTSRIGSYDLAVPYPRKVFNEEDLSKELLELGLFSRQTLIVVPHHTNTGFRREQSLSRDDTNSARDSDASDDTSGGYFGYVKRVLSYVNPFSYLGSGTRSSNSEQESNNGLWQYRPNPPLQNDFSGTDRPYRPYSPNRNTASTSGTASKSRKPTASRFGSNIHTLNHSEDDARFNDKNAYWNGNSTQYGGDNNDK